MTPESVPPSASRYVHPSGETYLTTKPIGSQCPVEIVSLADVENAVKLLVDFVKSVDEQTDFRPFYFDG